MKETAAPGIDFKIDLSTATKYLWRRGVDGAFDFRPNVHI